MIKNKITLFLMTEKGYDFLAFAIKKYKPLLHLVVIGSDKLIAKDYESEIINLCIDNGIRYETRDSFKEIHSEYALAISWRWLINQTTARLIVFHDSLLPKYRGYSPLVNMLINGETEIGVSAIFGATKPDAGDIVVQKSTKITFPIKISEAIKINMQNYLNCADFILDKILNNQPLIAVAQNESLATYSVWRDENDYFINWTQSAKEIKRFIDSVNYPYKGACTKLNEQIVRIFEANEFDNLVIENRDVGKVLLIDNGKPVVICGEGLLKIESGIIDSGNGTKQLLPLAKFRTRFES